MPIKLQQLNHPWLVAVWPGMGNVALNAGIYLLAKLNMHLIAEFEANDLFDVDQVQVKEGLIQPGRRPKNRSFVWIDPNQKHDLVVFLGEAQPPIGKYTFCRQLLDFARQLGIERIFTFAAMATQMRPGDPSRVFGAAADTATLGELRRLELEILQEGNIGGLNGVLLGAAVENGLHGGCLLGELPHMFNQLPFPKASLAILESFATLAKIDIDFTELEEQAKTNEKELGELLARFDQTYAQQQGAEEEESFSSESSEAEEETLGADDQDRIEKLFAQVQRIVRGRSNSSRNWIG